MGGPPPTDFVRQFNVNGTYVTFTVDTGAAVTLLTEHTSRQLDLEYHEPGNVLVAANGSKIDVLETCKVHITCNGVSTCSLELELVGCLYSWLLCLVNCN